MKVYGNLMNRMMESTKQINPQVGMGATIIMYSDRHPATIIGVKGNRVMVQEDNAKRTDSNGMSESQDYEYTPNTKNPVRTFSKRKDGSYKEVKSGTTLLIGKRDKYHDFSF